jgi:hypothetical protein
MQLPSCSTPVRAAWTGEGARSHTVYVLMVSTARKRARPLIICS